MDRPTPAPALPSHGTRRTPRRRLAAATAVVLVVLVVVRIQYLNRLGNGYDLEAYRRWTAAIQDHGLANVFDRTDTDYVGYHYLLWGIGRLSGRDAGHVTVLDKRLRFWLKAPGLLGDVVSTVLVVGLAWSLAARARARPLTAPARRLAGLLRLSDAEAVALTAGLLWGLHPALIYTSAYWGQNDSLVTAFALAAVWAALRGRAALAAAVLVAGATIKPQPMIVAPVVAWIILERSGRRGAVRAVLAGLATLVAGHLYFVLTGNLANVAAIYRDAVFTPQRLTFSAYNAWWPFARVRDPSSADIAVAVGPVSIAWGTLSTALVLGVLAVTAVGLCRRRDDTGVLLACAYLVFGFFMVGSGVHERYDLPALTFLLPALALAPHWVMPALAISATLTVNALMSLPIQRLYPQGEPAWLGLAVSAANLAALCATTWLMLRPHPDSTRPPGPTRSRPRSTPA